MLKITFQRESNKGPANHNSYLMSDDTWQEHETKQVMPVTTYSGMKATKEPPSQLKTYSYSTPMTQHVSWPLTC